MKNNNLKERGTGGRAKGGLWKTLSLTPVKKKHKKHTQKLHKIIDTQIKYAIIILYTKSE